MYSVEQTKQYEFKGATGLIQPEQSGKAEAQKGTKCYYWQTLIPFLNNKAKVNTAALQKKIVYPRDICSNSWTESISSSVSFIQSSQVFHNLCNTIA